jgi:hypothetical protein
MINNMKPMVNLDLIFLTTLINMQEH